MQSRLKILARSTTVAISMALVTGAVVSEAATKPKARAKAVVRTERPATAGVQRPAGEVFLSQGRGQLITLPVPITDVFVANEAVADVRVQSPTQLYVFGKGDGETSVYATTRSGKVAYSANIRVNQNVNSVSDMLKLALPKADITATSTGQITVLTGTVASPDDIILAEQLVKAVLNPGINVNDPNAQLKILVINSLKTATPLQVTLQVRLAEVSRSFGKQIGVNWNVNNSVPTTTGTRFSGSQGSTNTRLNLSGRLLGMNVLGALDLGETEGFVTTLASPNLTALSGETATFLVGGEVPIPITQTSGGVLTTSIEFKNYGISLSFSPLVLDDGRISLRVKPEVSEVDYSNAVNGIPGISTRRVETTVELGSGQSLVIGGLLRASNSNTMTKTPGAADVPILGALFRSNSFRRGETELMIVVTPYLVNPVPANQIVLPTDGYKAPTDLGRVFMGEMYKGSTEGRPVPTVAQPRTVTQPSVGAALSVAPPAPPVSSGSSRAAAPTPGFSN